jgi:signal transduction histidine kinase
VRARTQPVREDGRITGVRGILIDVTEQRRLENEMLDASASEQRRIGQDLHDGLGQELAAVAFMARTLEQKLAANSPEEAREAARIGRMIDETVGHTRDMVSILNPVGTDRDGLMGALATLSAGISSVYKIPCVFEPEEAVPVDDSTVATHVFRIAQEAVNNAVRHGEPRRIEVALSAGRDECTLEVTDDGRGLPEGWRDSPGMGLRAMRHRAQMIGGSLHAGRGPEGGTVIRCSFPCRSVRG